MCVTAVLQAVRGSWFVQRPGGQAASDSSDLCPHVCGVRKNHRGHLQSHGPAQEAEGMKMQLLECGELHNSGVGMRGDRVGNERGSCGNDRGSVWE